jgi:hypothetical protein
LEVTQSRAPLLNRRVSLKGKQAMKYKTYFTAAVFFALLRCIIAAPIKICGQTAAPAPTPPASDEADVAPPADEEMGNPDAKPAPKVEGKPFEMPQYPAPKATKKEAYAAAAMNILQLVLTNMQKPPKPRQRSGMTDKAAGCGGASYRGKCQIYEFTNADFPSQGNTCAQAAMATAMWNVGLTYNNNPAALAKSIYDYAPPKITLGNIIQWKDTLGTDWRQFNYGMDGYKSQGIKYTWVDGEAEIKKYLAMELPVVIMLDTGTLPQYNYKWWTGHWVTAFGYDASYIYVSNFPNYRMTWSQLNDAFRKGTLAVGHGTSGRAAVVWK